MLTTLLLAAALAMDAFAVSITTGIQLRRINVGHALRMGGAFGGFQFLMPVIGWLLGVRAQKYIEAYDHWLAFALLAFVGGKMIWEACKELRSGVDACDLPARTDPTRGGALLLLAVATSVDALAVGLSLALLEISVWVPAVIIGAVCFLFTAAGLHLGRFACTLPGLGTLGGKANLLGGLVLLAIGLKILHEHGVFS